MVTAALGPAAHAQSPEKFERVVPAKPQPATPKPVPPKAATPAGRTSTMERELFVFGDLLGLPGAKSAEACRDACLRDPKCAAWSYNASKSQSVGGRPCWNYTSVTRRETYRDDANHQLTGGVISPPPSSR